MVIEFSPYIDIYVYIGNSTTPFIIRDTTITAKQKKKIIFVE